MSACNNDHRDEEYFDNLSNNTATMKLDDIPDVQVSNLPHLMHIAGKFGS